MSKEWKVQLKDSKGVCTTFAVYSEVVEDIKKDLSNLKNNRRRVITYKVFTSVMMLYFKLVVKELWDGYFFALNNRLGEIRIAKRKMDRWIPNTLRRSSVDGQVVYTKRNQLELARKYNWFWHYLNWSTFKRYRTHEIKASKSFIAEMMKRVNRGVEYIDYTPLGWREDGIIRKIK